MKKTLLIFATILLSASFIQAKPVSQMQQDPFLLKHNNMSQQDLVVVVKVQGMVCDFCARGLEKSFGKKKEVKDIDVNLNERRVTIHMEPGADLSDDEITNIIESNGISTVDIDRS